MRTLLIMLLAVSLSGCWEISRGEKVGTVIGVTLSGMMCKTWEVKIIRGGLTDGSGGFANVSFFTIENRPDLVQRAQEAMNNGREVRVAFWEELNSWCRSDSQSVFASHIEYVKDGK